MFKKYMAAMFLVLPLLAGATEKIILIYGFSPASNQANFYRALAREVNSAQTKYEIVVETKPGAGGAIAANHTLANSQTTLLGGGSTFFLRSNFDRATGYSTDNFKPVFVQAVDAPLVLLSKKYKTLKEAQQAANLTVSISGYGSHSHLMAEILKERLPQVRIVNYATMVDANRDIVGQHIDSGWNFLSNADDIIETGVAHAIAITGIRNIKSYQTFKAQGIADFDQLSSNTAIFAGKEMPDAKTQELFELFRVANSAPSVKILYDKEFSTQPNLTREQTHKWYNDQVLFWTRMSGKIKSFQK
jgi:tripartite-type tricarboxylate transporter receptor subunit TctC